MWRFQIVVTTVFHRTDHQDSHVTIIHQDSNIAEVVISNIAHSCAQNTATNSGENCLKKKVAIINHGDYVPRRIWSSIKSSLVGDHLLYPCDLNVEVWWPHG